MKQPKKIGLIEITSMAVGTMIGASLFSIFGLGAKVAGHALPWAFLLSGVYAYVVAYSYATLGSQIVSNTGPIGFILKGIGDTPLAGAMSILLWMSYVVSISLLAKGFAGNVLPLMNLQPSPTNYAITEAVLILFFVGLNFFGAGVVGKSELLIVGVKLSILFLFIAGGLAYAQQSPLKPLMRVTDVDAMVNASVIFFLSYIGFGLITNASEDIKNPEKNIPRAIYASIAIVLVVYVLIAVVTLGNLSLKEVIKSGENAIAAAAEPFLGKIGYTIISFVALISIASSLNAGIFGGANVAYSLAKNGKLPAFFERRVWFNSTEGLYITAGLGLTFALLFDMGAIATITSSVFTVIYIAVIVSHIRLRKRFGGTLLLLIPNLFILSAVFVALMIYQWNEHRGAFYGTILTFAAAWTTEKTYRMIRLRIMKEPVSSPVSGRKKKKRLAP